MGGRRSAQGRARSNAAAAPRTPASSKRRPTICSPIGSPSLVNPHGTDAAGCPVRLNGYVNGIHAYGSTRLPAISVGLWRPIGHCGPSLGEIPRACLVLEEPQLRVSHALQFASSRTDIVSLL